MASDSPARLHLKKILHIQLSTTRQVQRSASLRAEEINHMLNMISQDGTSVVPVRNYIGVALTNIMSLLLLKKRFMTVVGKGDSELEQVRQFRTLLEEIAKYTVEINLGDFIPAFKWVDVQGLRKRLWSLRERMDAFVSKIISEHLAQRENSVCEKDLVDVLLDQMEDETLRFKITRQHVNSIFWTIFTAGTETSIHAVEWAIAECIHNPTVMRKAQSELDKFVGKSRRVEDTDIPNLKYLQAICKEVFRLHPASAILIPHDCKVFGYNTPSGTSVMVNVGAIARDPSIWADLLVFRPERFLEGMPHGETDFQGHHFEFLPFGSGRRQCPGIALGVAMVHILTASLLHSFEWFLPDGVLPVDLDMTEVAGFVSERAQPLTAILKPRLFI